jgi:hypothetical protein
MTEKIYLPVLCAQCQRVSMVSLESKEASQALKCGDVLSFTCAFDETNWIATPAQREKVLRLLNESEKTRDRPYLRLRQNSVPLSA